MSDWIPSLSVAAIALLPVGATAYFGYRYGYRQQVSAAGCIWRALSLCAALSWSLVGGSSHDASWALILPSLLVVALPGFASAGGEGVQVLPPVWIVPLAHLAAYGVAVLYGYRSREREYSKFPPG